MPFLLFSVDAALLAELGERLVGKPYTALAELVKNSYDADSPSVHIKMNTDSKQIIISDKGIGMSFEEFRDYWMRIGSIHKRKKKISDEGRVYTGSKGVGRLSAQFLADNIQIETISKKKLKQKLIADLDWRQAVSSGDLIKATVQYSLLDYSVDQKQGTTITLSGLKHTWSVEDIQKFASEIWFLQPPFRNLGDKPNGFDVKFESSEEKFQEQFDDQINAILDIWVAKIVGEYDNGNCVLTLEFRNETPIHHRYKIQNSQLTWANFEIRIYHLIQRQPKKIKVNTARKYLRDYGGVYVYDGGFQLPYYGDSKNDWLRIEQDHSHRLNISKLLPKQIQEDVYRGMQSLPTLSRILGVVNVNSQNEDVLDILVTRNRYKESLAFDQLEIFVRYAIDFYSINEQKRKIEKKEEKEKIIKPKFTKLSDVVDYYEEYIDNSKIKEIKAEMTNVIETIETEAEKQSSQVSLVAPLATVGISSLAAGHDTKWQQRTLDDILINVEILVELSDNVEVKQGLMTLHKKLSDWHARVERQRNLYSYFLDNENIVEKQRFVARTVIDEVIKQLNVLSRGITIKVGQIEYMRFPEASLVELGSIFQNVLINAFNALLDSDEKIINISSNATENKKEILIQDTGAGVDLSTSEELFEPFVRKIVISEERRTLGYGGSGLGLTIVKLIATNIGCEVSFVQPKPGFNTAFSLRWNE